MQHWNVAASTRMSMRLQPMSPTFSEITSAAPNPLVSSIFDSDPPLARVVRSRRPKVGSSLIRNSVLLTRIA